ncbi:hypothetical protein ACIQ6R_24285 [Streptomyces sp. NPDC096048]|uniref:hypothetical protein n=1 Tax=Streptomyces sp. NPDC096048 TaxID=3366072 RepID=UPI00381A1C8D
MIVMMFWFDHDVSGWGWFAMSVGMIAFWALIVTAAVLIAVLAGIAVQLLVLVHAERPPWPRPCGRRPQP